MCAILDANVVGKVFGSNRSEAAKKFFVWINTGKGRLVTGGKVLEELNNNTKFMNWRQQAILAGKISEANENEVNARTEKLKNDNSCISDDQHVIALAQVSGARLLYSNDGNLIKDFKHKKLIDQPRGKIYPTGGDGSFQNSHKRLLGMRKLCRTRE